MRRRPRANAFLGLWAVIVSILTIVTHGSLAQGSDCTDGLGRAGTCKSGGTCVPTSDGVGAALRSQR